MTAPSPNQHGDARLDSDGVHRVDIGGGLRIGSDGSYSSEYSLAQVHARCADELVRMEHRRAVILAFREANEYPKGVKA